MGRASWWCAVGATTALLGGCRTDRPATPQRDCRALIEAARRAAACDPKLAVLADLLEREPDEEECRVATRGLLHRGGGDPPAIRSVHSDPADHDVPPLTVEELAALESLPQPATVILVPDVPPQPGVPRTRATIGGVALVADGKARLTTTVRPGARTLELHHAGRNERYCLELHACDTLTVTAHGSHLARHPDIRPGNC